MVKTIVPIFGAHGLAAMWEAVFAGVGVALLAILNAVRVQNLNLSNMIIQLSSVLDVSAQTAFKQVKRPALLHYVADPLIRFVPSSPFPPRWQEGVYETQMRLFGLIPLGRQLIRIELPQPADDGPFRIRDNGQGHLARTWDHWIIIDPVDAKRCRYSDKVTIRAGLLTPFVWLFALGFYAWRQYRWQRLVQLHFQPINGY